MNKLWQFLAAAFLILVVVAGGFYLKDKLFEKQRITNCQGMTVVVNDSTTAICAKLTLERGELLTLREAAKAMNGKPVAGVGILLKPDTVWRTDTVLSTENSPDGTRTATYSDSTEEFKVALGVTAPPGDAPIRLDSLRVTTPPRSIEVGFVRTKDGVFAVSAGRGVTPKTAFYAIDRQKLLTFSVGAGVSGNPLATIGGLADIRPSIRPDLFARADVQVRSNLTASIQGGFDDRVYVKLTAQRLLFRMF